VSVAIIFRLPQQEEQLCVLVDVGKTMRDSCIRYLAPHHIQSVHGILLTHGHADAILGLDDVRDFQKSLRVGVKNEAGVEVKGYQVQGGALPIYLHQATMDIVSKAFSYLTVEPMYLDKAAGILERRVAHLDFKVIPPRSHLNIAGLPIETFPVFHGGEYVSLGFSFGAPGEFLYISDVSSIPPDSIAFLQTLKIKVLVLDLIGMVGIFPHVGLDDALKIVEQLKPEKVYFIGMGCEHDHEYLEKQLAARGSNLALPYDGFVLEGFSLTANL